METAKKSSPIQPTIGRIVIYVWPEDSSKIHDNNSSQYAPAIITREWSQSLAHDNSAVNLKVFADGNYNYWRIEVPYDEEKKPGTWHWPPLHKNR